MITAIPFRLPEPFDLPPSMMGEPGASPAQLAGTALALLAQVDAADAMAVAFYDQGRWSAGPADGSQAGAWAQGLINAPVAQQAVTQGSALLLMGEPTADDAVVGPAIAGALGSGPVGFVYVLPLLDPAGQARGVLALHRPMAAGPLNHDQPAIARALTDALGAACARQGG